MTASRRGHRAVWGTHSKPRGHRTMHEYLRVASGVDSATAELSPDALPSPTKKARPCGRAFIKNQSLTRQSRAVRPVDLLKHVQHRDLEVQIIRSIIFVVINARNKIKTMEHNLRIHVGVDVQIAEVQTGAEIGLARNIIILI